MWRLTEVLTGVNLISTEIGTGSSETWYEGGKERWICNVVIWEVVESRYAMIGVSMLIEQLFSDSEDAPIVRLYAYNRVEIDSSAGKLFGT